VNKLLPVKPLQSGNGRLHTVLVQINLVEDAMDPHYFRLTAIIFGIININMNWHIKSFSELNTDELYRLLQLRAEVFVVEQNCPYQDIDGKDRKAIHVWGNNEENDILVYCRLLPPGVSYAEPSIGRVVTAPSIRNSGAGRLLMEKAIDYLLNVQHHSAIRISAQQYLEKFYTSLGFQTIGDAYLEDNIPHLEMLLKK
jgi:ElaA protein